MPSGGRASGRRPLAQNNHKRRRRASAAPAAEAGLRPASVEPQRPCAHASVLAERATNRRRCPGPSPTTATL
eukprot:scaffold4419_cov128-Isochrysis_galbana.AAC.8